MFEFTRKIKNSFVLGIVFVSYLLIIDILQIENNNYNIFTCLLVALKTITLTGCLYLNYKLIKNKYITNIEFEWIISSLLFFFIILLKDNEVFYKTYIYEYILIIYIAIHCKISNKIYNKNNLIKMDFYNSKKFAEIKASLRFTSPEHRYSNKINSKILIREKKIMFIIDKINIENISIKSDFVELNDSKISIKTFENYLIENNIIFDELNKEDFEIMKMIDIG